MSKLALSTTATNAFSSANSAPRMPEPIAAYFAADGHDGRAVARCFNEEGQVLDEGQTYSGFAAIEAWKTAASSKFAYTAMPSRLDKEDHNYIVTSRVTGDFPGSPVDLRHIFTLEHGKIASLQITP